MARFPWAPRLSSWEKVLSEGDWGWGGGSGDGSERLGEQVKTGFTCWSGTEPSFPLAAPS